MARTVTRQDINRMSGANTSEARVLGRIFTPEQVHEITGMSAQKVRALCASGRLGAVNTSLGKRPIWAIPEESLNEFFTPAKARQEKAKAARRQAIDRDVEKVF